MAEKNNPPWRIYYADGSTYDGNIPENAPPHGVVAIVQPDPYCRRNIMSGWDWYYWNDTEGEAPMWWGIDEHGIFQRLYMRKSIRALVQGITIDSKLFKEILKKADSDSDFIHLLKGD